MRRAVLPFLMALAACHGSTESTPAPSASAEPSPPPGASTAQPAASAPGAAVAPPAASGAASTEIPWAPAATAATAHTAAGATGTAAAPSAPLPPGTGSHFAGKNFTIDVPAPDGCAKGQPCSFLVKLTATGEFHVNKEYPYKLTMTQVPGVEFLGNDVASRNVFSRIAGDFTITGEKTATMVVRYQPGASGPVHFIGTLKLSVCSASTCLMDVGLVKASVPVR